MKLRCSRCRAAWIDAASDRTCSRCGLVLGSADIPLGGSGAEVEAALDVDVEEDVARDLEAAPNPPPSEEDFLSLTGVTGAGAWGHHGVPERVPGAKSAAALVPFEGYLLSLVDGATYVDDVVAASGLSVVEAAKALAGLRDRGLIRFRTDADPVAARRRDDGTVRPEDAARLGRMAVSKRAVPVTQAPAEDISALLAAATVARDALDFSRARDVLRLATMAAPTNPAVAALLDEVDNPRQAKQRAKALHDRGTAAHRAGNFVEAVERYRGALREFEPSAVIHHKLAMVLVLAGISYDEAERHLLRAMQLQPTNESYVSNLARLRQMRAESLLPPRQ